MLFFVDFLTSQLAEGAAVKRKVMFWQCQAIGDIHWTVLHCSAVYIQFRPHTIYGIDSLKRAKALCIFAADYYELVNVCHSSGYGLKTHHWASTLLSDWLFFAKKIIFRWSIKCDHRRRLLITDAVGNSLDLSCHEETVSSHDCKLWIQYQLNSYDDFGVVWCLPGCIRSTVAVVSSSQLQQPVAADGAASTSKRHMRRSGRRSIRRTVIIGLDRDPVPTVLADFGPVGWSILVHGAATAKATLPRWDASVPTGTRGLIMLETFSMTDFSSADAARLSPMRPEN